MEYMAAQMDRQIEAGISQNEQLCIENEQLKALVYWAYTKLHGRTFTNIEDALNLDEMKLMMEIDA